MGLTGGLTLHRRRWNGHVIERPHTISSRPHTRPRSCERGRTKVWLGNLEGSDCARLEIMVPGRCRGRDSSRCILSGCEAEKRLSVVKTLYTMLLDAETADEALGFKRKSFICHSSQTNNALLDAR